MNDSIKHTCIWPLVWRPGQQGTTTVALSLLHTRSEIIPQKTTFHLPFCDSKLTYRLPSLENPLLIYSISSAKDAAPGSLSQLESSIFADFTSVFIIGQREIIVQRLLVHS